MPRTTKPKPLDISHNISRELSLLMSLKELRPLMDDILSVLNANRDLREKIEIYLKGDK